MPRLRKFVADAEAYTSLFRGKVRPANRDNPSWMNVHFSSSVLPGTRLVVAIAPALTIGLVRPSGVRSTAPKELNASPVALAPSLSHDYSGPITSQTSAKK